MSSRMLGNEVGHEIPTSQMIYGHGLNDKIFLYFRGNGPGRQRISSIVE